MGTLHSLQYLRAFAAVSVVTFHVSISDSMVGIDFAQLTVGAWGVDVFFVISGFIMWTVSSEAPPSPAAFAKRRLVRVVPLYWLFTLFTAFVSTRGGIAIPEWTSLWKSLLFVPFMDPTYPGVATPLLAVGWTLNLEIAFYLLFGTALFLPKEHRFAAISSVLILAALAGVLRGQADHPAAALYAQSVVLEFALGLVLGRLYLARRQIRALPRQSLVGAALMIGALVVIVVLPHDDRWRGLVWGLPAFAFCAGALLLEPWAARAARHRAGRVLSFLGAASYAIYLAHYPALAVMALGGGVLRALGEPAAACVMVAGAVVAGCVVHVLIERPLTRLVTRSIAVIRTPRPRVLPT